MAELIVLVEQHMSVPPQHLIKTVYCQKVVREPISGDESSGTPVRLSGQGPDILRWISDIGGRVVVYDPDDASWTERIL